MDEINAYECVYSFTKGMVSSTILYQQISARIGLGITSMIMFSNLISRRVLVNLHLTKQPRDCCCSLIIDNTRGQRAQVALFFLTVIEC